MKLMQTKFVSTDKRFSDHTTLVANYQTGMYQDPFSPQLLNATHLRYSTIATQLYDALQSRYSPPAAQLYDVPSIQPSTYQATTMQQSYHQPQLQYSYQVPAIQPHTTYQPPQQLFLQLDSGLVIPSFNTSDDPVVNLNKAVAFLTSYASHFLPTNNQLRTSSNPRNQATIQDGRVTI
ncbi:hypothetical protein Tco_0131502 [Tanacetum coccineum]